MQPPDRGLLTAIVFQSTSKLTVTFFLQPQTTFLQTLDDYEFIIAPLIFTAFALFTRLWRIGLSPIVTWDEAQ
jgi:hypothetical protein